MTQTSRTVHLIFLEVESSIFVLYSEFDGTVIRKIQIKNV